MKGIALFIILFFFIGCEPWVDIFEDDISEEVIMFESTEANANVVPNFDSLKVVTWNIRN